MMATKSSSPNNIDVDDLAREKVQEVEETLDRHHNLSVESIISCFSILKQIITAADLHRTNDKSKNGDNHNIKTDDSESIYADYADDNEQFNAVDLTEQFATNSVKWTIRVKAFKAVHRIVNSLISTNKSTVLKILPDLVRLSFVAATSPFDDLKIQGFQMFRDLINRFALVEEREFPGHSILEQYKTQFLSALKPAFNIDAPPYITAIACQVCSLWICNNLEKDSNGLRRTFQLFEPSIAKLESQSINPNSLLYQEIELEQERLDILGSWAQLYITSHENSETSRLLIELVKGHIETLVGKWWEALKDYALLIMLSPKSMSVSHDNEHVYTREVALQLFSPIWPKLTMAVTIWLCKTCSEFASKQGEMPETEPSSKKLLDVTKDGAQKYFRFICGILMCEFCKCLNMEPKAELLSESTIIALKSLTMLLSSESINDYLSDDVSIAREFYSALGGTLVKLTTLRNSHRSILKNTLSQIFKLILTKFRGSDKIVKYSLAHLLVCVQASLGHPDCNEQEKHKISQQLAFTNLISVVNSRLDLLDNDPELMDAFVETISMMITEVSCPSMVVCVVDSMSNVQKNLPNTSRDPKLMKRLFLAKQIVLLKFSSGSSNEKHLVEVIIRSLRVDLEHIDESERHDLLKSLIRALVTKFDNSNQIVQVLRNLEEDFATEFTNLKKSDSFRSLIGDRIKPVTKVEKDSKVTKKTGRVPSKKPSSTIVLKSDFSNFYSK